MINLEERASCPYQKTLSGVIYAGRDACTPRSKISGQGIFFQAVQKGIPGQSQ